MSCRLLTGSPRVPHPMNNVVVPPTENWSEVAKVRLTFAFVTKPGVTALVGQNLPGSFVSHGVPSEWIVGINQGITEPRALDAIMRLEHAQLRLFVPNGRMTAESLVAPPRLHAKLIAIDAARKNDNFSLLVGSANLTGAAIGQNAMNFEAGALLHDGSQIERNALDRWWKEIRKHTIAVDDRLIAEYAKLRTRFLRTKRPPADMVDVDAIDPSDIAAAQCFWIQAGKMSGREKGEELLRYQTDLPEYLIGFFHAARPNTELTLQMPGGEAAHATLSPKRHQHHRTPIWRLYLPRPEKFGLQYYQNALHFKRVDDTRYKLTIGSSARVVRPWRRLAGIYGNDGRTSLPHDPDGRDWGYYG